METTGNMQYQLIATAHSTRKQEIQAYLNKQHTSDYTYLLAGVHGDEPEGIYVLEQLFKWLQTQKHTRPILVIPCLNPDGKSINSRCNANGVDLNRNWPIEWSANYTQTRYYPGPKPLSEPENIFLNELFIKYPPSMIISFHSWMPILDHNKLAKEAAAYIAQFNNYKLSENIGYPTPGSLGKYADRKLKCGIITFECPVVSANLDLETIWQQNLIALQNYFSSNF